MKFGILAVTAGLGGPLIMSSAAAAEFYGIQCTMEPNDYGLVVFNVFGMFSSPG